MGVIVLLAGTFFGVFYLGMTQIFRIGASPQTQPKDVRVSNISDSSTTITWITEGETEGFIVWGESQNSISKVEREDSTNEKYLTHSVTLTGLGANIPYYFKINSNGSMFDNNSLPWQFTTGPDIGISSVSYPVSGSVIDAAGSPKARSLVYLNVGGYLTSTFTSDTGNFVFQLGGVRSSDLQNYITIDPASTLLEISVQTGPDGISSAQIFPQSAQPVPPMVVGQVYDLRNLPPVQNTQNPGVNLQLPENSNQGSKFDTSAISGSQPPTTVILENISEGEVVSTDQPQFFGKGPKGEVLTITVNSQTPITDTVTVPSSGSWSWTPPTNLAPGAHSVTITWLDKSGITRSLTRDFIVQASELPAFTATGSGATATPTVAPTPSAPPTPVATLTPMPTETPVSTPTETLPPVPDTGDLTVTIMLFIMGVAVVLFSFVVWKSSET